MTQHSSSAPEACGTARVKEFTQSKQLMVPRWPQRIIALLVDLLIDSENFESLHRLENMRTGSQLELIISSLCANEKNRMTVPLVVSVR